MLSYSASYPFRDFSLGMDGRFMRDKLTRPKFLVTEYRLQSTDIYTGWVSLAQERKLLETNI